MKNEILNDIKNIKTNFKTKIYLTGDSSNDRRSSFLGRIEKNKF